MRSLAVHLVAGAICLASSVIAQSNGDLNPIFNMCMRIDHQSTIKNNVLYIDGGIETFVDSTQNGAPQAGITLGYNNYLIAVDMNSSWNWGTNVSESLISKTPKPNTETSPPVVVRGALYRGLATDNNVYLYGGTTSFLNTSFPGFKNPSSDQYSLWSYDTVKNTWGQYDITNESPWRPNSGAYAEAPDQGLAFYFNGQIDNGSSIRTGALLNGTAREFLEGMVVIDLSNQTARNVSTSVVSGNYPRTRGKLQYLPAIGAKGVMAHIGGSYKDVNNLNDEDIGTMVSMSEIDVFDISSVYGSNGTWYKQNATGDIPAPRVDHCLIAASAPDNSSHQIYLYGGRANDTSILDDIYALSLPSFHWIKLYQGTSPRYGMTCHLVGNRQMLTVGGYSTSKNFTNYCDWENKGVAIYDVSSLTWGSVFDFHAPAYTVPGKVVVDIGGTANGSANFTTPAGGWSSDGLAVLFKPAVVPGNGSSSIPTPPLGTSPLSAGSIAGIVVGCVLGLALIFATIWLFLHKRERGTVPEMEARAIHEKDDGKRGSYRPPTDSTAAELQSPSAELQSPSGGGQRDPNLHRARWAVEMGPPMDPAELPTGV